MQAPNNSTKVNIDDVKKMVETKIPFLKKVGIVVEDISRGRVKLSIPFDPENLNHLGTYQAGTYLTLAEVAGATLLATVIDLNKTLLLARECHLKFGEPARKHLSYEGTIDQAVIAGIVSRLKNERKTDVTLNITLFNERTRVSAEGSVVYYLRKDFQNYLKLQQKKYDSSVSLKGEQR